MRRMFSLIMIIFSSYFSLLESKVCKSIDVRNSPDNILEFSNCTIIEGRLQIVLMEYTNDPSDFDKKTFANLDEITDYLVLYMLEGLTSLDLIFPKLTTIRGKTLFDGYALVIYQLSSLEEIGLTKLRRLGGNVRIDHSDNLCYVDTINWKKLGVEQVDYEKPKACDNELCLFECAGYCWNTHTCHVHKIDKCHPSCIGCTKENSSNHCVVCKYYNNTGTCVQSCPKDKITDVDAAQCITTDECRNKPSLSDIQAWSILNQTCIKECPLLFQRNSEGVCVRSDVRICGGMHITHFYELERMEGCTHIEGALGIALPGYVEFQELERILGKIVFIRDYLLISRSNSLLTLNFFPSLTINGTVLYSRIYSLFVTRNLNLQEGFHENTTVTVENGLVLFQDNPELCQEKLSNLNYSVLGGNNGYQTNCSLTDLKVTVSKINSTNVTLEWRSNSNETVGYRVYYTKYKDTLLKLKNGIDCCEDVWQSVFVHNETSLILKRLTPFQRYAYYIVTLINAGIKQTPVYFFKTRSGEPSEPVDLKTQSQTDSTISLQWKKPGLINGNLSHYHLTVYREEDSLGLLRQRNYCVHPHQGDDCKCPLPDEIKMFLGDEGTCFGTGSHYCNDKTVYHHVEDAEKRIQKRSLFGDRIREFQINTTDSKMQTFVVFNLRPYSLYILFLQACNHPDEDESYHCGGSVMESQRTIRRRGADAITAVTVKVQNQDVLAAWSKPKFNYSVILAYRLEVKMDLNHSFTKCVTSDAIDSDEYYKVSRFAPGTYALRVQAVSLAGSGDFSEWKFFVVQDENTDMNWLYGFLILLGTGIGGGLVFVICRRYRLAVAEDHGNLIGRMSIPRNTFFEENQWSLDDDTLQIIRELGQNQLGIMYRRNREDRLE